LSFSFLKCVLRRRFDPLASSCFWNEKDVEAFLVSGAKRSLISTLAGRLKSEKRPLEIP